MADSDRIAQLKGLAEADPNDELAHSSLGRALVEARQFADAGPYLQRVLALNSQNSKAYQLLGEVQKATGHPDLAIQTLTNGYRVAHRKGDLMPMKAMGELLQSLGAPTPTVAEKKEAQAGGATAGFACRRCGGRAKLRETPFPQPPRRKNT